MGPCLPLCSDPLLLWQPSVNIWDLRRWFTGVSGEEFVPFSSEGGFWLLDIPGPSLPFYLSHDAPRCFLLIEAVAQSVVSVVFLLNYIKSLFPDTTSTGFFNPTLTFDLVPRALIPDELSLVSYSKSFANCFIVLSRSFSPTGGSLLLFNTDLLPINLISF